MNNTNNKVGGALLAGFVVWIIIAISASLIIASVLNFSVWYTFQLVFAGKLLALIYKT